jgi:hypothetical protein
MVIREMTFTYNGAANGHGYVLVVKFGALPATIWQIGAANVQLRTYQWAGREVCNQGGEGPFGPTLHVTTMDVYSSLRVNGYLLTA